MHIRPPRARAILARPAAIAASAAIAAGILTAVSAGPAAAQTNQTMYLSSDPDYNAYAQQGVTLGSLVTVKTGTAGIWEVTNKSSWTADGVTGTSEEIVSVYSSGTASDLCLGLDLSDNLAELNTCGADGTYWVQVPNGDGNYLYSRYWLDEGAQEILVVYAPGGGYTASIDPPPPTNDNWGRWSFANQ